MVMKLTSILVLLVLSSIQDLRVSSYTLTASRDYVRIPTTPINVTLTCSTEGVPVKRCQFRWWDNHGSAGPLLELSGGAGVETHSAHLSEGMRGYAYTGSGLERGDCGVTIEVTGEKRWLVSCRVETASGGWKYAWTNLHARDKGHLTSITTVDHMVVLPGQSAELRVKGSDPLSRCNFFIPGIPHKVTFKEGEKRSGNDQAVYSGEGLQEGDCGFKLANVQEDNNGPALFWISNADSEKDYSRFVALIVARPPSEPVMRIVKHGDDVTATCVVQGSRPIASLTWLLGDHVIRRDSDDDSLSDVQDEWRWPWTPGSISQTVNFTLKPEHKGLKVTCRVAHFALKEPLEASEILLPIVPATTEAPEPTTTTVKTVPCKECPTECEAKVTAEVNELAQEAARVSLETAKVSLKVNEARAWEAEVDLKKAQLELDKAKSNAQVEQARAKNAQEELEFQRERRKLGHRIPQADQRTAFRHNRE